MTIDHRISERRGVFCDRRHDRHYTDNDGNRIGISANSFTSLSLDPPLVLFCVDAKISSFEAFESCRHFNINVLTEEQMDIIQQLCPFQRRQMGRRRAWIR